VIDWLNDNSGAVQAVSAVVLALTLMAVTYYAKQTRKEAEATERMAGGVLRPVILQWLENPQPVEEGRAIRLTVDYQNIGSGPAVNIEWTVRGADREWWTLPQRVGMGVRELQGRLIVRITPQTGDLAVVARYEDVSGAQWESILRLVERDGELVNGETRIRRLTDDGE